MPSKLNNTTVEIVNSTSRWLHHDGTVMGLLNTGGGWDMYANNSGSVWTANYGWLHDYFFSTVTNCGAFSGNCGGNTGNCYNGPGATPAVQQTNCGNMSVDRLVLEDGGSSVALRTYRYSYNCNCDCDCLCACY